MEKDIERIISENLISLRKLKNLKQTELSEAIGYSDKTISRWENGTSMPDISTLVKLADFYNISLEDLISEKATDKYHQQQSSKSHEEIVNFYSLIALGVLTVWVLAVLIYLGLIMIKQFYFWQIYILAIPASCIVVYKNTRRANTLKWLNFLLLSLIICGTISFLYLSFISYNFWQIFILILPLEGISVVSALFTKKQPKQKKSKKQFN